MSVAKAIYDGRVFVPLETVHVKKNQKAYVTFVDDFPAENTDKPYLRFAGSLSQDDFAEITEILKDTEIIHADEW